MKKSKIGFKAKVSKAIGKPIIKGLKSILKIESPSRGINELNNKYSIIKDRPSCFVSDKNIPFTLCTGASSPQEFAENVCPTCWYYNNSKG